MSEIEVVEFCPLNKKCESVRDGKIYRCKWFQEVIGKDPQTGEPFEERQCAFVWHTIVGLEMARTNRGQTAAIESFRNETVRISTENMKRLK